MMRSHEAEEMLQKLRMLGNLREEGALTEEEFKALKTSILSSSTPTGIPAENPISLQGVFQHTDLAAHVENEAAPVTYFLIAANIIVFALMFIDRPNLQWNSRFLLGWGADYAALTLNGQAWRLVSSAFVHLNLVHLVSNMMCLYFWGRTTEQALGRLLFSISYVLFAIVSGLVSITTNPSITTAGASGAIAGLLGVMCIMCWRGDPRVSKQDLFSILAINVGLGFLPGVDWVAHIGGLLGGLLLGAILLHRASSEASFS